MPTKIRYNGTEIATIAAGETKILECSGKKMRSNVAVEVEGDSEDLSVVLSEQKALISELKSTLEEKAVGNGAPVEIDSLDESLLVSENVGKVYKHDDKLYQVNKITSLKGLTIKFNEHVTPCPVIGENDVFECSGLAMVVGNQIYNGKAKVVTISKSHEYLFSPSDVCFQIDDTMEEAGHSNLYFLHYTTSNSEWRIMDENGNEMSYYNPAITNFDCPALNENVEFIEWIIANARVYSKIESLYDIVAFKPISKFVGEMYWAWDSAAWEIYNYNPEYYPDSISGQFTASFSINGETTTKTFTSFAREEDGNICSCRFSNNDNESLVLGYDWSSGGEEFAKYNDNVLEEYPTFTTFDCVFSDNYWFVAYAVSGCEIIGMGTVNGYYFEEYLVPTGIKTITENYVYNVANYKKARVKVALPVEVSAIGEMKTELENGEVGGIYKFVGAHPSLNTGLYMKTIKDNINVWKKLDVVEDGRSNYLLFSSPETFTINVYDNAKHWNGTLEYSIDNINWNVWSGTSAISSGTDGKLYMRGIGNTKITGSSSTGRQWVITGNNVSCSGNIEVLLDYKDVLRGYHPTMQPNCYVILFKGCTSLTTAPELPATTLVDNCYGNMFQGCTALTTAPELPATTLAYGCYGNMFYGCTALTTAPELPATTLAYNCYYYMFQNCTSLISAPELPATTLAYGCYYSMFYGCSSLTTAPALPATTLAKYCYRQMFYACTSLTAAPELPVTTLAEGCYYEMFSGCSSLTTAPELPATTLIGACYGNMFRGCTSLTTAPSLPATTLASSCYSSMFYDCTSLTTAPELPATTLAYGCYQYMFYNCKRLTTAPALPATTLAEGCYRYMFYNCYGLTKAPSLPATTLAEDCYTVMFFQCYAITTAPALPATTLAEGCYDHMFQGCSKIKLSTEQTDEYTIPYRIPTSGTGTEATSALDGMFLYTGGTFKGTPSINTTYYLHNSNSVV